MRSDTHTQTPPSGEVTATDSYWRVPTTVGIQRFVTSLTYGQFLIFQMHGPNETEEKGTRRTGTSSASPHHVFVLNKCRQLR